MRIIKKIITIFTLMRSNYNLWSTILCGLFLLYLLSPKLLVLDFSYIFNILVDSGIFQVIHLDDEKSVTVSNVKLDLSQIWEGLSTIGGAAVFSTGAKAASSFITKSGLPPTVKVGFVLASGAASYFTFETSKLIWKGTQMSTSKPKSVDITIKESNSGSFTANSPLEESWNNDYFSNLVDILSGVLNIQLCVFVLINLIIIFIIMKKISDMHLNLE